MKGRAHHQLERKNLARARKSQKAEKTLTIKTENEKQRQDEIKLCKYPRENINFNSITVSQDKYDIGI